MASAVLVAFGLFWGCVGVLLYLSAAAEPGGQYGFQAFTTQLSAALGIVFITVATVEVLAGILAWRGRRFATTIGLGYSLVFGLGSAGLAAAVEPGWSEGFAVGDTSRTVTMVVLIVSAVGYGICAFAFVAARRQATRHEAGWVPATKRPSASIDASSSCKKPYRSYFARAARSRRLQRSVPCSAQVRTAV